MENAVEDVEKKLLRHWMNRLTNLWNAVGMDLFSFYVCDPSRFQSCNKEINEIAFLSLIE
jgi:hypothetical protein